MTPHHIKSIRKSRGFTTRQLEEKLRLKPNGGRYIRMIESGEREPSGPICYLMELLEEGVI